MNRQPSVLRGRAALPLLGTTATLLLAATATAQQGPGSGPPPNRSTPVQSNELRETWNDRVSAGAPVGAFPEFDGWSLGLAMPFARSEHAVAEMRGQVWVLGGYPPDRLPTDLVQVYDPVTSRWTLGPNLPQPLHHTVAAAVDGKLDVIGSEIEGASTGKPAVFVANTWVHDPAVGGWVARAPMPTARSGGGKAVIDGKIYVAGGRPPGGSAFEVHDPATRRWTNGAPLPAPRGGITGAVHAGCMFVFGGEGEMGHVLGLTPSTYGYDPRADRWTRLPDLPIAIHGLKGSAVIDGRIFLPGGAITLGGNTGTNAMQLYRPPMGCE